MRRRPFTLLAFAAPIAPVALIALGALAACSAVIADVQDARLGAAHPAKPADCVLAFVEVDPSKGIPNAPDGTPYEMAGTVSVYNHTDANERAVRDLVRPRACAMGGEAISVAMSSGSGTGSIHFMVWARHAPTTSKTF